MYKVDDFRRNSSSHVVLEEVHGDNLALDVAGNPEPVVQAGVSHQPVVFKAPLIPTQRVVELFEGELLTFRSLDHHAADLAHASGPVVELGVVVSVNLLEVDEVLLV